MEKELLVALLTMLNEKLNRGLDDIAVNIPSDVPYHSSMRYTGKSIIPALDSNEESWRKVDTIPVCFDEITQAIELIDSLIEDIRAPIILANKQANIDASLT